MHLVIRLPLLKKIDDGKDVYKYKTYLHLLLKNVLYVLGLPLDNKHVTHVTEIYLNYNKFASLYTQNLVRPLGT
jgi:hypothetical protein